MSKIKTVKDHKGKIFGSFSGMCRYYKRAPETVKKHLRDGWTLQEALETPRGKPRERPYKIKGKHYYTINDICDDYKVDIYALLRLTKKNGGNIEDALNQLVDKDPITDPAGNIYKSLHEMYKAHKVDSRIVKSRRINGWNTENQLLPQEFCPGSWFTYKNIKARKVCVNDDGEPYFKAECLVCNKKAIVTANQLLEHAKLHEVADG